MKRFRRHKARRPVFWIRDCFDNSMAVGFPHTSQACHSQIVISADEIAPGNPEFSAEDRDYTVRRIRCAGTFRVALAALSSPRTLHWWCVAVKIDIGLLTPLVTAATVTLQNILNGGATLSPNAMDVLGVWRWSWSSGENLSASNANFAIQHAETFDIDLAVSRRLDSNECISLLWGTDELPVGSALPSAAGWSVTWQAIRSTLYSESVRR